MVNGEWWTVDSGGVRGLLRAEMNPHTRIQASKVSIQACAHKTQNPLLVKKGLPTLMRSAVPATGKLAVLAVVSAFSSD